LIQTLEINQYLQHIDRRLREEQARLTHYIDQSTKYNLKKKQRLMNSFISLFSRVQLIHLVEMNLITNHIQDILSKGFENLMNENRFSSVTLLYQLFQRIGSTGVNEVRDAFSNYIKVDLCHRISIHSN